jgi:GDSL-like Lipase/Acylhydrolase family
MPSVVLIGDSIFDNARYTSGQPDVISHVHGLIPAGWQATLLAVDGATTNDIPAQLRRLPPDATHLVLSVGGNNAIMNADVLTTPVQLAREALVALAEISRSFEETYCQAVEACLESRLPLALCTIYNGRFEDAAYQRMIGVALMVFNDVILRVAIKFALAVIDLRFVCTSPEDYANPIEPSSAGGAKIARAIVSLVSGGYGQATAARIVIS